MRNILFDAKITDLLEQAVFQLKRLADAADRRVPPILERPVSQKKLQPEDINRISDRRLWELEQEEKAKRAKGEPIQPPQSSKKPSQ